MAPQQVSTVQPLEMDPSWLPIYKLRPRRVDFIQAFILSPAKDEEQKLEFLKSICSLCRTAKRHGLAKSLDVFCQRHRLVEHIKVLLQEEPMDQMPTLVRCVAMAAITELSSVEKVLEGKERSLLHACFSSVFWLPPAEEGWEVLRHAVTLRAMDTMLETLVLSFPASRASEELQNIFQTLLSFTRAGRADVQEKALGRIQKLCSLLDQVEGRCSSGGDTGSGGNHGEVQLPILGQLLGRLVLLKGDKKSSEASEALGHLHRFMQKQRSRAVLETHGPELHVQGEAKSTCSTSKNLWRYLQPSERAGFITEAIKAMKDSSVFEKKVARKMLDVVMRHPDFWLVDVPKIMSCLCKNLEHINEELSRRLVLLLILLVTNRFPTQMVRALLSSRPPGDSAAAAMWDVVVSMPHTVEKILKELLSRLQSSSLVTEDIHVPHRVETSGQGHPKRLGDGSHTKNPQRDPSQETSSLLLQVLLRLARRPDVARKAEVFLPPITEVLQDGSTMVKEKILVVFRDLLGHLKREEASPIAVKLAEKLLPLFDHECSRVRELSIGIFRDLLETVVGCDKKRMKKTLQRALLPLFFHRSDRISTVAKVSLEALLAAAELLNWKEPQRLAQTQQMWRIGECLLAQDTSRAEELLEQSLPYLEDAQPSLREAAIRFIGLAARHLRDKRQEKMLAEIFRALKALEKDNEASTRSLATQTIHILKKQPGSGSAWRRWCCWARTTSWRPRIPQWWAPKRPLEIIVSNPPA